MGAWPLWLALALVILVGTYREIFHERVHMVIPELPPEEADADSGDRPAKIFFVTRRVFPEVHCLVDRGVGTEVRTLDADVRTIST
jgi:hypothetical protein